MYRSTGTEQDSSVSTRFANPGSCRTYLQLETLQGRTRFCIQRPNQNCYGARDKLTRYVYAGHLMRGYASLQCSKFRQDSVIFVVGGKSINITDLLRRWASRLVFPVLQYAIPQRASARRAVYVFSYGWPISVKQTPSPSKRWYLGGAQAQSSCTSYHKYLNGYPKFNLTLMDSYWEECKSKVIARVDLSLGPSLVYDKYRREVFPNAEIQ